MNDVDPEGKYGMAGSKVHIHVEVVLGGCVTHGALYSSLSPAIVAHYVLVITDRVPFSTPCRAHRKIGFGKPIQTPPGFPLRTKARHLIKLRTDAPCFVRHKLDHLMTPSVRPLISLVNHKI